MEDRPNTMWEDDIDFPSVEDREDDIEQDIPDEDREWVEWWRGETSQKEAVCGSSLR